MWNTVKRTWGGFWYWAGVAFAVLYLGHITFFHEGPRSGAQCGPHHHWRDAGIGYYTDLSCVDDSDR